jgi:hypothetical protein
MRRYNGQRPELAAERHPRFRPDVRGRVPYWDVDPRQADVEVVGDLEASPFRAPDGKLRVFGHYMDEPRIEALTAALGPPAGTLEAELTSSFRTVLVYPPDGRPYMLKFPGSWFLPDRQLTPSDVARSVTRSRQLRASPDFLPEPAGLVAPGVDLSVLYRPLSASRRTMERGRAWFGVRAS